MHLETFIKQSSVVHTTDWCKKAFIACNQQRYHFIILPIECQNTVVLSATTDSSNTSSSILKMMTERPWSRFRHFASLRLSRWMNVPGSSKGKNCSGNNPSRDYHRTSMLSSTREISELIVRWCTSYLISSWMRTINYVELKVKISYEWAASYHPTLHKYASIIKTIVILWRLRHYLVSSLG